MLSAKKELFTPSGGGYQISRSVRLRSSASAYLNRTFTTPTNNLKWTWSAWIKRGKLTTANQSVFSQHTDASNRADLYFDASDNLNFYNLVAGTVAPNPQWITTQVFRDPAAWYHIVVVWDSANATAGDRTIIYVNGVRVTAYSQGGIVSLNQSSRINSATLHNIAYFQNASAFYDGYLTEINFIDGQALTPSSFGETNAITGVWQPKKYAGTYGTNGFYLNFSDNSTAAALGTDFSGNSNNWTPSAGISITAGATYDSMTDVPTLYADGGNGRGNYPVANPLQQGAYVTLSNGNLTVTGNTATNSALALASVGELKSGKWYWEYTQGTVGSETCGIVTTYTAGTSLLNGENIGAFGIGARASGTVYGGTVGTITSWTTGDIIGLAVDCDNGAIYWSKNGTWLNSGVPTSGSSKTGAVGVWTPSSSINVQPAFGAYNGGFVSVTFGQRPFSYTPPTGFKALNTQNLPTPTISNGASYMAATTYTGTGSALSVSNAVNGVSFQPDFVWTKPRSTAVGHTLFDSLRGVTKYLQSNTTGAEGTAATSLTAFNSDGFTVNSDTSTGANGVTYIGWQWNAGGSTVTNTSGTISAQVRANPTAGFSVVTYTGTGANATVGHGLGVAPRMIIVKGRSTAGDPWAVYHSSLANTQYLYLNTTAAVATGVNLWNSTTPTSSVFSVGASQDTNRSAGTLVAYCFAAVAGYSAFGSYTGNGSTDGPFIYTAMRPRFIMLKRSDTGGANYNWFVYDSARNTFNATQNYLEANLSTAEQTGVVVDFLSNGFKVRTASTYWNASGGTYIYAAFGENPLKFANAR